MLNRRGTYGHHLRYTIKRSMHSGDAHCAYQYRYCRNFTWQLGRRCTSVTLTSIHHCLTLKISITLIVVCLRNTVFIQRTFDFRRANIRQHCEGHGECQGQTAAGQCQGHRMRQSITEESVKKNVKDTENMTDRLDKRSTLWQFSRSNGGKLMSRSLMASIGQQQGQEKRHCEIAVMVKQNVKVKRRRVLSQVMIGADRQPIRDVVSCVTDVIGGGSGSRDHQGRSTFAVDTPTRCHESETVDDNCCTNRQHSLVCPWQVELESQFLTNPFPVPVTWSHVNGTGNRLVQNRLYNSTLASMFSNHVRR